MDREKVINDLQKLHGSQETMELISDTIALLKEQEQIKSPDEFESLLLGMFDSIWGVEIDHPIF